MPKSRFFWFSNGMVLAVLIFAALNSLSYFFRSPEWWQQLTAIRGEEAIGFPLQIWSSANAFRGWPLNTFGTLVNLGIGLTAAVIFGGVCAISSKSLNAFLLAMIESEQQDQKAKLQFSLKGMLVVTTIAAVVATLIRQSFGPTPVLLLVVYFFGPAFLILLAMIPRGLNWQSRMVLLIPSTILLIGYAIYVGRQLGLELDRVMFGVYVIWVPQTVVAATAILIYQYWKYSRQQLDEVKTS